MSTARRVELGVTGRRDMGLMMLDAADVITMLGLEAEGQDELGKHEAAEVLRALRDAINVMRQRWLYPGADTTAQASTETVSPRRRWLGIF